MARHFFIQVLLLAAAAWTPARAADGASAGEEDLEAHHSNDGCVHMSIVHSTNAKVFKRAVQFNLANRSDVAYYAKRRCSWQGGVSG
jgi:hypothetical protein